VWNAEAAELWGVRAEEVAGSHVLNLDIGLPLAQIRDPLRRTLAGDAVDPIVVDAVNRRGRSFHCRVTFAPRRGSRGGDPRGVIMLMEESDAPDA
jgi:two-component system CheB/CheR fusion protein